MQSHEDAMHYQQKKEADEGEVQKFMGRLRERADAGPISPNNRIDLIIEK